MVASAQKPVFESRLGVICYRGNIVMLLCTYVNAVPSLEGLQRMVYIHTKRLTVKKICFLEKVFQDKDDISHSYEMEKSKDQLLNTAITYY